MSLPKKIAAMAVPFAGLALLLAVSASAQPAQPPKPAPEAASSAPTHEWKVRHWKKKHEHGTWHQVNPASKGGNAPK
jgi:acyl-CoA synthetase (NDP forming)